MRWHTDQMRNAKVAGEVRKLLREGMGVLYHQTSARALNDIMINKTFDLTYGESNDSESKHSHKGRRETPWFMSMSRTPHNRYRNGARGVTLVIDADKIRQRYKVRPVDYWAGAGSEASEQEERLYSDEPEIKDFFKKYVKEVHVCYNKADDERGDYVYLQYFDNVWVYGSDKDFALMNKRRATPGTEFFEANKPQYGVHRSGESQLMQFEELITWLEGGGKDKSHRMYKLMNSYPRDLVDSFSADVHNAKSFRGGYARELFKRYDAVRRAYRASSPRDLIKKFALKHADWRKNGDYLPIGW